MGFATASSATTANGCAGCAACAPLSLLSLHWEDPDRPTWPGTGTWQHPESPRISEGMRMADDFWDSLTKLLEFFKVRPIEVRNSVTTNQLRHGQTPWHPWLSPANCSSSSPILPWNSVWLQNGCNLSLSYYVILIMITIIEYDNHPIIPHLSGCSFSSMVYSCSDATRKQSKTVQNGPWSSQRWVHSCQQWQPHHLKNCGRQGPKSGGCTECFTNVGHITENFERCFSNTTSKPFILILRWRKSLCQTAHPCQTESCVRVVTNLATLQSLSAQKRKICVTLDVTDWCKKLIKWQTGWLIESLQTDCNM